MYTRFEELNLHVYHCAQGLIYDGVIWCLGPLVDESRKYSLVRLYLAAATYKICRRLLRVED